MKYWAFISYSHKDTAVADWLHKKLETYRVPRSLVGTASREGAIPARIMPIFRDRDELPTSCELGDNLQKSLQQSRYLIVICSPPAAQSRWVEEEVGVFKNWHGRERIIALIAGGIPNASDHSDPASECFPHALRFERGTDSTPVRVEPIAADLRPEGDGRERALLKIVAGLVGVGFDDLYQREKRRQLRHRVIVGMSAAAAILILIATWWSMARLGRSQKEIRQEVANVRQNATVATTEFKNVRPQDKEAVARIQAAKQQAMEKLDLLTKARLANAPDNEWYKAYSAAGGAIADLEQTARTTEESIYAREVAKPLRARLYQEGLALSKETRRRSDEKISQLLKRAGQKSP